MREVVTLEKIRIQNVRSLKDTGDVPLSPITLLVGENSSGKSTFLRTFPLIRQSISKRTDGPILWAGDVDDYVDFGSFEEAVTNDESTNMTLSFTFKSGITRRASMRSSSARVLWYGISSARARLPQEDQITYSITISQIGGRDCVSELSVQYNNSLFEFELTPVHPFYRESGITVDGFYEFVPSEDGYVPGEYYMVSYADSRIFEFFLPSISQVANELLSIFEKKDSEGTEEDEYNRRRFISACQLIGYCLCGDLSWETSKEIMEERSEKEKDLSWVEVIGKLDEMSPEEKEEVFAKCKLMSFYDCFAAIEDYLSAYFRHVHYIAPLRATAERYYRLRNLSIDEVDYQGKNLAMFLNGLSRQQRSAFQKWTREYFGFHVDVKRDGGHISIQVSSADGIGQANISDTGFGYSQILPIITQLWDLSTQRQPPSREVTPLVIAIEQPELHLHPALQAKLANAFRASIKLAEENNRRLQLLIETHSETIVNFFGRAIAREQMSPEDVSVILFEKCGWDNQTEVKISQYDKKGYLQDWPLGFFMPGE